MNLKQPTKRDLEKIVNCVKRHKGNRSHAAKELDVERGTLGRLLEKARKAGFKIPGPPVRSSYATGQETPNEELEQAWSVYERHNYNKAAAAEALGLSHTALSRRLKAAQHKLGLVKRSLGVTHANKAKTLSLPAGKEIKRYILTCVQNNTALHDPTWAALIELSKFYDAEIKVSTFTYIGAEGSEKRGTEKKETLGQKISDRWYDPRVVPFISDHFEQLAPGLVWCGHFNILPTAADPLSGLESINGRASGVFPHPRIEMRPVATAAGEATKFNWTTGTVGLRNYIQKRAGIVAEFYHCFGGLLVEVDSEGNWWCRQLNADSEGNIYDLDVMATPEGVFNWIPKDQKKPGLAGMVFGDIHRIKIDPTIEEATWGKGGLVDLLKPEYQVLEDLLNFNPSHHVRRDPHERYKQRLLNKDVVYEEIKGDGVFLDRIHRPWSKEIVKDANHVRHLDRFLKEVDWRDDLINARAILEMNLAWLDAIDRGEEEDFLAYEWTLVKIGHAKHAHFMNLYSLKPEKLSLILCPERGGGIEVGAHHGHLGPNGAYGTPRNLSKLGRKNVIGDKHAPGIWGGTYVAGMTGKLRQGYNIGPGSWAAAHVPIYPNGKRQVLLFWKGMPFAPRN